MKKINHPLQILDKKIKKIKTQKHNFQDDYFRISVMNISEKKRTELRDAITQQEKQKDGIIKELEEKRTELMEAMLSDFDKNTEYIPGKDIPKEFFHEPAKQVHITIDKIAEKFLANKLQTLGIVTMSDLKEHYKTYGFKKIFAIK